MKVILSRKGFDSSNGGMASPIFSDGTMLSMPIPSNDDVKYSELFYNGKSYSEIINELNPRFKYQTCHLDPDIRRNIRGEDVENWKPAFGQIGASSTMLKNVSDGDLILFFGWFRFVEEYDGKLRFARKNENLSFYNYADLHVIYGYMQVEKIINNKEQIKKEYPWHPHSNEERVNKKTNILITPKERLSFNSSLPGYGTLDFRKDRVLTKEGFSRGIWQEHSFLMPENLEKTRKNCSNDGIYYSGIWQELVLNESYKLLEWVDSILKN